jgi:threonine/homoserine/homoserine lactone efflux protein
MSIEIYLAFVLATALLIIFPGPNVTLIIASGIKDGRRAALLAVAGSNAGLAVQLSLAVFGMTSLMLLLAEWFEWLRWAGVAYLVWLGWKQWRASFADTIKDVAVPQAARNGRPAFLRGFFVAILNPKTMLFHAAFLPQFVDPGSAPFGQLLLLGITFLAVAAVLDSSYALLASRASGMLRNPVLQRWTDRITGTLMIFAGFGLALARRQ